MIRCREARASLRGGASHEAEGRRDARAGGADRVGPPTGWYRLRLLRQILDELVPGVEQFLLVDALVHNSRSRSIIALHPEIRGPA